MISSDVTNCSLKGAALIWDEPDGSVAGTKVWDDVDDIDTITSMPDEVTHSITDKVSLSLYILLQKSIIYIFPFDKKINLNTEFFLDSFCSC